MKAFTISSVPQGTTATSVASFDPAFDDGEVGKRLPAVERCEIEFFLLLKALLFISSQLKSYVLNLASSFPLRKHKV